MKKEFLEVGKIVSTKGLKGELSVECWCDSPEFLCTFKVLYINIGKNKLNIKKSRVNKRNAIILVDGINCIEEADELRGKIIYINRKDVKLEKGQYFVQDLIGLEVFDVDSNKKYGEITDVIKTGANDVYQITDQKGKNYLIPVIKEVIINIEIEKGIMLIKPLRGIFDEV